MEWGWEEHAVEGGSGGGGNGMIDDAVGVLAAVEADWRLVEWSVLGCGWGNGCCNYLVLKCVMLNQLLQPT